MTKRLKWGSSATLVLMWVFCVAILDFESSMIQQACLLAGLGAAIAMPNAEQD